MTRNLIASLLAFALVASASAQEPWMIKRGNVLAWSTSNGQRGMLKIALVDGQYFEAEQTNESNRAAGMVRLYGAIVENGRKVVMINPGQWKEVWDGNVAGNEIEGRLATGSASFTFRLMAAAQPAPVMAFTAPFVSGRTLKWTTDAGQGGTVFVAFVKGPTFLLEQVNARNPGAGVIKLDGEIKDGRVFIYNRKYNETWTGFVENGIVIGKINGHTGFRIFE